MNLTVRVIDDEFEKVYVVKVMSSNSLNVLRSVIWKELQKTSYNLKKYENEYFLALRYWDEEYCCPNQDHGNDYFVLSLLKKMDEKLMKKIGSGEILFVPIFREKNCFPANPSNASMMKSKNISTQVPVLHFRGQTYLTESSSSSECPVSSFPDWHTFIHFTFLFIISFLRGKEIKCKKKKNK